MAHACRVAVRGADNGKDSLPKTSAAIWPYSRKSYHSIVVPTVLAMTARRSWVRCSKSPSGTAAMSAVAIGDPPEPRLFRRGRELFYLWADRNTRPAATKVASQRRFSSMREWPKAQLFLAGLP